MCMSNLVTEEKRWLRTPIFPRRVSTPTSVSALLFHAITTHVSGLTTVEAESAWFALCDGERRSSHQRLSKTRRAVQHRRPQNPYLFQAIADGQLFPCQCHLQLPDILRCQACNHFLHDYGIAVSVLFVNFAFPTRQSSRADKSSSVGRQEHERTTETKRGTASIQKLAVK